MNESAYQDEQYDKAMGIGYTIDPPSGLMICPNVQCRHCWPTDLSTDLEAEPKPAPDTPDCPFCQSPGRLFTTHKITHKHKDNHGTDKEGA